MIATDSWSVLCDTILVYIQKIGFNAYPSRQLHWDSLYNTAANWYLLPQSEKQKFNRLTVHAIMMLSVRFNAGGLVTLHTQPTSHMLNFN